MVSECYVRCYMNRSDDVRINAERVRKIVRRMSLPGSEAFELLADIADMLADECEAIERTAATRSSK